MLDLKGKWALVTGASRGIGKLAAEALAEHGCNLILLSRDKQHTAPLAAVLSERVRVHEVACDLADAKSVEQAIAEIDALGVPVDVILNNAGVQIAYRTDYWQTPVSDYMTSFQINTVSPMMLCYHFIPKMIERGFGRVVNTTSGIRLEPEQAGYSAPNTFQQTNAGQFYQGVTYKSKVAAGLLGIFLGAFGVHNFYLGFTGKAVAQLLLTILSCGALSFVSAIWGLIEGIMVLTGSIKTDGKGLPLKE